MTHDRSSGPESDSGRPSWQGEGDLAFTNDEQGGGSGFGAGVAGDAPRTGGTSDADSSRPRRKRGSRGGKRGRRRTAPGGGEEFPADESAEPAEAAERSESSPSSDSGDGEAPGGGRKKRSRRGGRRRRSGSDSENAGADEDAAAAVSEPAEAPSEEGDDSEGTGGEPETKKRRRRGKRGGRRRKKTTGRQDDEGEDDGPSEEESAAVEIEGIPGEDDDLPELPAKKASRRGKKAKSAKKTSTRRESDGNSARKTSTRKSSAKEVERTDVILVNAADPEEVRVAVAHDGRIKDLQMTVTRYSSYVNDIYRGRVVNLEPAIGAAFVDFGQGRNGFLHASDVLPAYGEADWKLDKLLTTQIDSGDFDEEADEDEGPEEGEDNEEAEGGKTRRRRSKKTASKKGASRKTAKRGKKGASRRSRRPRLPIEKLLQKGQMVVCQITKDAIGDKGPTLTTYISIPGRYLVLMPSLARTGVSRKIEDEKERRRLKKILGALDIPGGMGVIVRTAGIGKTKAEIKRDLEYLLLAWEDFSRRLVSGRNPAPLYQESDVSVRTMRDLFGATTDKVIVDDPEVHGRMVEFTEKLMPENVERIQQHEGPRPLFHAYGVEQDFERIFQRRIDLPSGGSIVLDQTEALVAIDVNSGRTRDEGADFEDIALKANLEAAPEIARQMRLRDLGGIIVLDFIDMMRAANRRQVEKAFREAMSSDRARSKIGRISQFGLLELTRQRLGPGLSKLIFDNCSSCRGSGRRRSAASRSQAILRRLGAALTMKGFSKVEVRAHPDTLDYLKAHLSETIEGMREASGREISLSSVPDQVEDSVLRYLRADGREVRPGGRRKR